MAYATLTELKTFIGIPGADTQDDAVLTMALDAATAQVDGYTDRTFTATAGTREYFATDSRALTVDPIASTVDLVVRTDDNGDGTYETTWAAGEYRLEPINAADQSKPWTRIVAIGTRSFPTGTTHPGVQITATFGWPGGVPPAPVKLATLIQASRLFKRKDAPFGVAGSVEFGSEMRLLNEVDRDAQNLLRPYRRSWYVVV